MKLPERNLSGLSLFVGPGASITARSPSWSCPDWSCLNRICLNRTCLDW